MKARVRLLLALALLPGFSAAAPSTLWVAPLGGERTVRDAWSAGAAVLDRFPDALIVADETSAARLKDAGFRVSRPIDLPQGGVVSLLRPRGRSVPAFLGARGGERTDPDLHILWTDGRNLIVHTEEAPGHLHGLSAKVLRERPIRRPLVDRAPSREKSAATVFPPLVDEMAAQIDSTDIMQWIGDLAGANQVTIDGGPFTFSTRYTKNAQCDTAERYVYERFLAMGIDSVEFDPYTFQSTSARNVVATIVGEETPDRIYILGGHLDSTSPIPNTLAPGANDNASGTAAVLAAAEVLSQYRFKSTIKLIAFTGEEQGLHGSSHYAQQAAAAGDSILGVVICDMVAWYGTHYALIIEGENPWEWLMQLMNDACQEYTSLGTRLDYYSWGSDHVPFQNEGFPCFLAIERNWDTYPCYHSTCDTTGLNKGVYGAEIVRACLATVAHLAEPIDETTIVVEEGAPAPGRVAQNRPNPFNPATTIRFDLARPSDALVTVFDISGRRVRTVHRGPLEAGLHEIPWDGRDEEGAEAPSGVYFCRVAAGELSETRKMTLLR
ncbi:MAG: M20/M25/M40 family metallo-hydrolase [Candidatus Eisenbacteria bacterium]